jgi:hypothetical protein
MVKYIRLSKIFPSFLSGVFYGSIVTLLIVFLLMIIGIYPLRFFQ